MGSPFRAELEAVGHALVVATRWCLLLLGVICSSSGKEWLGSVAWLGLS